VGAISAKAGMQHKVPATASLYPNPVRSSFTVALAASSKSVLVHIYDAKGSVLYVKKQTLTGQQFQVDASALKAGQYFLHLQTEQNREVLKFIKQ
jgi:hypothetical protein